MDELERIRAEYSELKAALNIHHSHSHEDTLKYIADANNERRKANVLRLIFRQLVHDIETAER